MPQLANLHLPRLAATDVATLVEATPFEYRKGLLQQKGKKRIAAPTNAFPFLRLPPELRILVYEAYARLTEDQRPSCILIKTTRNPLPHFTAPSKISPKQLPCHPLSLASKQLRNEYAAAYASALASIPHSLAIISIGHDPQPEETSFANLGLTYQKLGKSLKVDEVEVYLHLASDFEEPLAHEDCSGNSSLVIQFNVASAILALLTGVRKVHLHLWTQDEWRGSEMFAWCRWWREQMPFKAREVARPTQGYATWSHHGPCRYSYLLEDQALSGKPCGLLEFVVDNTSKQQRKKATKKLRKAGAKKL